MTKSKKSMTIRELRERAAGLPRFPLCELPTPLMECPRLAEAVGGGRFFIKRDDLTAIGLGGNKLRKLEFSLGAAKAEGCDVLVHGLAGQSNYCRQAAAAAARAGMKCILVLRSDHKAGDPAQANRLLDYIFGAEVRMMSGERPEQLAALAALVAELKAQGHKPYEVGEKDEVLGAVGYALCLAEIIEQAEKAGAKPDYVCATGRGGTTAGLVLGKRLLGFAGRIQSFDVSPYDEATGLKHRIRTARLAAEAAKLLGLEEVFTEADVSDTPAYSGVAYGHPTEAGLDALLLLGRTEGIVVGPVYTAKGLSGAIDWIRTGRFARGSTVAFVHTGGTPEVFAYNQEILERIRETS
jgi:1-aminocyclopropane-1-carboxylate deaminase/D-cysteine desulfhydrase-like pyridoxal-dependent ACC family enzyme